MGVFSSQHKLLSSTNYVLICMGLSFYNSVDFTYPRAINDLIKFFWKRVNLANRSFATKAVMMIRSAEIFLGNIDAY